MWVISSDNINMLEFIALNTFFNFIISISDSHFIYIWTKQTKITFEIDIDSATSRQAVCNCKRIYIDIDIINTRIAIGYIAQH
jgi:hypothetical protein